MHLDNKTYLLTILCISKFGLFFELGNYRIAGNFRGRKPSRISRFERHPRKFSPRNFGHAAPTYVWFQAIRESFLREILTSYGSTKVFSLESLPLYGITYATKTDDYRQHQQDEYTAPIIAPMIFEEQARCTVKLNN